MYRLNKNSNNYFTVALVVTAVVITTALVSFLITSTIATPAAATTSSLGMELSPQPVLRERQISLSQTPINQTHILFTDAGNGTITLPNTTEAINFTGADSVVVSMDGTAVGKEVFTTLDGSESVNGTVYGIARFNMEEGTGKGIIILLLQTNSTGRLAPVDGMILAGHIEFYPDGSAESTMWEWQSGIPLQTTTTTTPAEEGEEELLPNEELVPTEEEM